MQKLVFTNGGGQTIDLTSGNFGITNWEGLSNTDLNIQTQQVPFQDGGVFLDALMEQREISVTVAIQDNNDLSARYELKRQLISALNPKLGEGILVYTNDYLSRQIKAVPQLPIFENKNSNDAGTLKASVTFSCCSPYWEDLEETRILLNDGIQKTIENKGDVDCGMKIELFTTEVTDPEIKSLTENKQIKLNGSFDYDIQINTNNGEKQNTNNKTDFVIKCGQSNFKQVAYSEDLIIGISNDEIFKSKNGTDWNVYSKTDYFDSSASLRSIAYGNGKFVIGGVSVTYTSTDGNEWIEHDQTNYEFDNIIYVKSKNKFYASGFKTGLTPIGIFAESTDGINWSINEISQHTSMNMGAGLIVYAEDKNMFVYAFQGDNFYALTSTNGTSWTSHTVTQSISSAKGITYGKGQFVIYGYGIYTSSDCNTWNQAVSDIEFSCIIFTEEINKFVGLSTTYIEGQALGKMYISQDGLIWTVNAEVPTESLKYICFIKSVGIFVLAMSDNGIAITEDCETVTKIIAGSQFNGNGIAEGNGVIVVIGDENGVLLTSADGNRWERIIDTNELALYGIVFDGQRFVIIGDNSDLEKSIILTSTDGKIWNQSALAFEDRYRTISYSPKLQKYLIAGNNDVKISSDLSNWTVVKTDVEIKQAIWVEDFEKFVIVGFDTSSEYVGLVSISANGTTWTDTIYDQDYHNAFNGVAYSSGIKQLVIVGRDLILRSQNGIDLIPVYEYNGEGHKEFDCVVYSESRGQFITAGSEIMFVSNNAESWNEMEYLYYANKIIYSSRLDKYIIIGNYGMIIISENESTLNLISSLTSGSDMSMKLKVGENKFIVTKAEGNIASRISFRQKYIGV